jgi:glutathione S-transferase
MAEVAIYSASVCPFAHRTRLTLVEKGVGFSLTEINLEQKPDWFREVSPYEKVPVIKHGEVRVWESAIINEYLDEVLPQPPLLPADPAQKAQARIWIDFANTKFINAFYKMLLIQDAQKQEKWKQQFVDHLYFLDQEAFGQADPYWQGDQVSLVDLTYYPWFERWSVLAHYRNLHLPSDCKNLQRWWEAMAKRDSVQQLRNADEFYIEEYEKYAKGTATGITAQEMREN